MTSFAESWNKSKFTVLVLMGDFMAVSSGWIAQQCVSNSRSFCSISPQFPKNGGFSGRTGQRSACQVHNSNIQ